MRHKFKFNKADVHPTVSSNPTFNRGCSHWRSTLESPTKRRHGLQGKRRALSNHSTPHDKKSLEAYAAKHSLSDLTYCLCLAKMSLSLLISSTRSNRRQIDIRDFMSAQQDSSSYDGKKC